MLAGATRGETGNKVGGGPVRLSDVDTRELAGFQNKLICCFMLSADMVGGGFRKLMSNADGLAFLESELVYKDGSHNTDTNIAETGVHIYAFFIM